MHLVEINLQKIIALCKRFHVRKLWVFGSILTDRFNDESDVDLCVDFDWENIPLMDAADNFFDFQYALEEIFGHTVDHYRRQCSTQSIFPRGTERKTPTNLWINILPK